MESVTLELRPRIQSCNMFIAMKDSTESHKVKLKLRNNKISIKISDDLFDIDLESLIIIPESLSSLAVSDKWISFRVQTSPVDATVGTFSIEVIDAQKIEAESTRNEEHQLPPRHTELSIVCKCCKNLLIKSGIIFQRVLPLPSDDCDPGAWFCCSHAGRDLDIKNLLHPRENDYFYGSHYCILNKNLLLNKYKLIGEDIVCNRCLTVLGIYNSKNFTDSIKFWNNSLEFTSVSSPIVYYNQTSPWCDFKAAFLYCINNDIFNREIIFLAIEQNCKYLLFIKPMEKNLCLYTDTIDSKFNRTKNLNKHFVTKILYRYEKSQLAVENNETDMKICRISVQSIIAGIDNLVLSSQKIPPIYRTTDAFYNVGYVL